jgi:hypothetical protein
LTKNFDEDPQAPDWVANGLDFGAAQRMTAPAVSLGWRDISGATAVNGRHDDYRRSVDDA